MKSLSRCIPAWVVCISGFSLAAATPALSGADYRLSPLDEAPPKGIDQKLRATWEHSVSVASYCNIVCDQYTRLKQDQAALAGLVHEIGKLPMLTFAEDYPELLADVTLLERILDEYHGSIGQAKRPHGGIRGSDGANGLS